jgi:cysteine desulfurase
MAALDAGGVCASAGSACQSGAAAPSHVLAAIDAATDSAHIRLTCGRTTTSDDVGRAIPIMHDAITQLRDRGGGFL